MSPEEIQQREFQAKTRGYDKAEVREFLTRVADQVRAAQNAANVTQAQGVVDAAPLSPDDDRFEALGDRIAGLLRSASESAAAVKENADSEAKATVEIAREASELMRAEAAEAADAMRIAAANDAASVRTAAEDEAEQVRAQARAAAETAAQESERLRSEAEQYKQDTEANADAFKQETEARALEFQTTTEAAATEHKLAIETEMAEFKASTEAEAAELREASLNAGETELADKRVEIDRLLEEATADRETAMNELADARAQVTELLEQARSQSDFLRHEADEIIRGKVRTQVERAEERLQVLRNSEVASRDRIATAHAELTAAMERLDASPAPELSPDTDQEVLEAAKARGEETNWGGALAAPIDEAEADTFAEAEALDADLIDVEPIDVESDVVEPIEAIDGDHVAADTVAEETVAEETVAEETVAEETVTEERVFAADAIAETAQVETDVPQSETVAQDIVPGTDQGEITMAEVFGGDDIVHETPVDAYDDDFIQEDEDVSEFATEHAVIEHTAIEHDAIEHDTTESGELFAVDSVGSGTDDMITPPEPPLALSGGFGETLGETLSAEAMAETAPIETDESELLTTFEVEDNASVEAADEPVESFDLPTRNVGSDAGFDSTPSFDDEEPAAADYGRFDRQEESTDRIPVGVGAGEIDGNVPENEDALARLVREAMQRAVDSARSTD